jgi:tetratricopeptide (TPR) repeat protein
MTTPEDLPSPNLLFQETEPLLKNWLNSTLEQPEGSSHGDLQLAALRKIEEYDFTLDGDLELACCLLTGNECRDGARKQAMNAQLKIAVEKFAKEFFTHGVRNRLLLFDDLNEQCREHPDLTDRLSQLQPGLQVDAAVTKDLDGNVAELAKLTLELFLLPQPEKSRMRREWLADIFKTAKRGVYPSNLEWCKAAFELHDKQSQIACLEPALMQSLGWAPEDKKGARMVVRRPTEPTPRPKFKKATSFKPVLKIVGALATVAFLIGVRITLERQNMQRDREQSNLYPIRTFENIDPLQHLESEARHTLTSAVSEAILQRREEAVFKNLPTNAGHLRAMNYAMLRQEQQSIEVLTEVLGQAEAKSLLALLTAAENDVFSPMTTEELTAIREVRKRRLSFLNKEQTLETVENESLVTVQPIQPAGATEPTGSIVGIQKGAGFLRDKNRFAEAVQTIRKQHYDQILKPSTGYFEIQARKLTEILKIYDDYTAREQSFDDQTVAAIDDFRAVDYEFRARVNWKQGNRELALTILGEGIAQFPDRAKLYALRGSSWNILKRRDDAIADMNRAIEIGPETARWYEIRGSAKAAKDDLVGAVFDFNRAIALDPNWVRSYYGRALARSTQKLPRKAIDDLTAALKIRPGHAWSLTLRAQLFYELRDYENALTDAEAAIEVDPQSKSARNLISSIHSLERGPKPTSEDQGVSKEDEAE